MSWASHISEIRKKSYGTLWTIIRNLGYHAPFKAKHLTYLALVRSKLEYASCLWNPHAKGKIEDLERVQRRATNFLTKNCRRPSPNHMDYTRRLQECNLLPLSYHREVLDVIFFLKSFHGKTGYNIWEYVRLADEERNRETRDTTEGTKLLLRGNVTSKNEHFFPNRIVCIWNSLPAPLRGTLKPLSESLVIKQLLNPYYYVLRDSIFDPENTCTWISFCRCARCRTE